MTSPTNPGYMLHDPRVFAAESPYTFFLPEDVELAAVSLGDLVKLQFEHVPPGLDHDVERMWVTVTGVDGDHLQGVLTNTPFEPTATIRHGDVVRFERYHISAIHWNDEDRSPPHTPRRTYWDRCLVDDCVLEGLEPVEFIYREAPEKWEENENFPDSGWRIRGRAGNATDEEFDARTASYVALGAVLNKDDSWLHLIDEPVGVRYMRDFQKDIYVPD